MSSELIVTIGKSTAYISRVFSYYTHSSEEGHRALIWPKAHEVLITSLGRLPDIFKKKVSECTVSIFELAKFNEHWTSRYQSQENIASMTTLGIVQKPA